MSAPTPEDSILSHNSKGAVDLREEAKGMRAWGIGQKPYERIGTETMWLMLQARKICADVNKGAAARARCCQQFWKDKKRPMPLDKFCNDGIAASIPTAPEVEDARHLTSGIPSQPIGRLVLR